jgi:hypothetical protein
MPYTGSTPIIGEGKGDPDKIADWAIANGAQRPDELRDYLDTVYRMAPALGLNPDVVVGQSHLETGGWNSLWWNTRLNPAGIGVTGDARQDAISRVFSNGEAAALGHMLHLYLYTVGDDIPSGFSVNDDPRRMEAIDAGYVGFADVLDNLTNTWAVDDQYGAKIAARLNLMEAAGLLPASVEAPVAYKAHQWPGLKQPVYLPDWIPVEVKIIDHSRFRSFVKSSAHTKTTFHDTGNPNTNADAEYRWAAAGRQGAGVGGYNGIFDDRKIIITQPFDEVVWAAGTPEGNRTSYHFEMAWGGGVNFTKALEIGEALHGGICAAKGWNVDTAMVKHQYWYGKWCPGQILNKGLWSAVVKGTTEAATAARAAAGGDGTGGGTPAPVYAKPSPIAVLDAISMAEGVAPQRVTDPSSGVTFVWIGDRVKATKDTPRYRYATRDGEKVGPDLKAGEEFDADWLFETGDTWWLYTPYGTRVIADDTQRISDVKGAAA